MFLDNGFVLHTEKIGTIWMENFHGKVRVVKDVRHVIDSKKNILSLGVLERKGYKIILKDGGVKILEILN